MKACLLTLLALMIQSDPARAQAAKLWPAETVSLPAPVVDGNSPSFWYDGQLRVFTSSGTPLGMQGDSYQGLAPAPAPVVNSARFPLWIEAVWVDEDGTVYAWYHHEPPGLCGGKLTAPEIGALVSEDGGQTFRDLGIVLASGDPVNCDAPNGFFAGGHGDFSVVLDRDGSYFYFLFTNYGGDLASQGIGIARMAFDRRANPAGAVFKRYGDAWDEPGIGGRLAPVLPAKTGWDDSKTDSFWGPAVHWNTFLESYVVLLNHACCNPGWPQEGIYIFFARDLSAPPSEWTEPQKLIDGADVDFSPAYYPQAVGTEPGETDTVASESPRFFIKGISDWYLVFSPDGIWGGGGSDCQPEDPQSQKTSRSDTAGIDPKCGPSAGGS